MYTLITGASSGIGLEMAKIFASQKSDLILVARSKGALEQLATELKAAYGVNAEVLVFDLNQTDSPRKIFATVEAKGWQVHTLVNNAGFGDHAAFAEEDWSRIQSMVQVNITALLELTHLFLPKMKQVNAGNILNVASTAAFQPGPFMAVYYASKAFVLSFSEALHEELSDTEVHVSALCPGPTESGFQSAARLGDVPLFKQ